MKIKTLLLGACSFIVLSCGENQKNEVIAQDAITLNLMTGEGIIESIDMITSGNYWTQERFDSINTAINQLASNGLIDKDIDEDMRHLENLFTASASWLEHRVDSQFKCSSYGNYQQLQQDLKFLEQYHRLYMDAGLTLDNPNIALAKVSDIFENYKKVLDWCDYHFYQKVRLSEDYKFKKYSLEYLSPQTKKDIEKNKYYDKYFSHNSKITGAVKDFPRRVRIARKYYMKRLEEMIEKRLLEDSLTCERVIDIQSDFYQIANGVNQEAIDKFDEFVERYVVEFNNNNENQNVQN